MSKNSNISNSIYIKSFDPHNAEKDAQEQVKIYNMATKEYPGPNSENASAEGVLSRQQLDYFDANGIVYAIDKENGEYLAYCSSIQVTETIIRIGYPWSLEEAPEKCKEDLFNTLITYYKSKNPNTRLEFEVYTLDYRWTHEVGWLENHGFNFYAYWLWPIFNIEKINFNVQNTLYNTITATTDDFNEIISLFNKNDDNKRFRAVSKEILKKRYSQLLKFTQMHILLKNKEKLLGFIAVFLPNETLNPATLASLLVIEHPNEVTYAKILLQQAVNFTREKGFTQVTAWFKESSLFHTCLNPYLKDETKWYHGILQS